MAKVIYAGWDLNRLGTATIGWNDGSARTASPAIATYAHLDFIAVTGSGNYGIFKTPLKTAMDAVSGTTTVNFGLTSLVYTLDQGAAWTITSTTNTLMRNILGLPASDGDYPVSSVDMGGGVHRITSTRRPYYLISIDSGSLSRAGDDIYEPDGIAEDGESGGDAYGIVVADEDVPDYFDFSILMETREATRSRYATAAVPWTYEHFFKHCRNIEPFGILDSGGDFDIYKLRADGASWRTPMHTGDYDGQNDIPFRTRHLGSA